MKTIRGYEDLNPQQDNPPRDNEWYVRCASDHLVLIAGHSGECYLREDGEPWQYPGYEVFQRAERNERGETVRIDEVRRGSGAWFDHKEYPVKKKAAA